VSDKKSYGQILKSSSIMGGAAVITMMLGMVRTKFAAVLIGASGVGLMASFIAIQGVIETIAGMGIRTSAVREVAAAIGNDDQNAIGRAVLTLRRVSWLTGLIGMMAMVLFSPFISQLTFGSSEYTYDIAALGIIILMANISGGQMALIQGMRRIGDLARVNIIGGLLATITAIGFYYWLGLRGIVPSLVVVAAITLAISWRFARRVPVPHVELTWRQTFVEAGGMVRLGLAMMWVGLISSMVYFFTITLISQQLSLQAVGIFTAAYALSGMFVDFVFKAMAADYYPRLTGLVPNKDKMNHLVNEQTEIGILLAVPGLLATLTLAPWLIQLFYTSEFLNAVDLVHWFILGCFIRVFQWPIGFLLLALGKATVWIYTQTAFSLIHAIFIWIGVTTIGVEGAAAAYFALYLVSLGVILMVAKRLTGFSWSNSTCKLLFICAPTVILTFVTTKLLQIWPATIIGLVVSSISLVYCMRAVVQRVGTDHRIARLLARIPGIKTIIYAGS